MTKVWYMKLSTLLTFSTDYPSSTLNYLDKQGYCPMQKLRSPAAKNDSVRPSYSTYLYYFFLQLKMLIFIYKLSFYFHSKVKTGF